MGLLDDAIREHLELKRRAGSDADADEPATHHDAAATAAPWEAAEPAHADYGRADAHADAADYDDEYQDEYEDEEPDVADPLPPHRSPPPAAPAPVASAPNPVAPLTEEHWPARAPAPDVLEQTPDFLQETPEHDRLWFEQAPPQEFDFDK